MLLFWNLNLEVEIPVEPEIPPPAVSTPVFIARVHVETVCEVLAHYLGVTDLWTNTELEEYVTEGYNQLTMATGCLWATDVSPDTPTTFNFTAKFEQALLIGGWWGDGPYQFTSEFERDWLDNANGPANHNYPWEFVDGHVEAIGMLTEITALVDLPEDLYEIERSTWNAVRADALRSRHFEVEDSRYELNKGEVSAYIQDKDGLRRLRKWRVPSAAYVPYPMDEDSTEFGYLVQIVDADPDLPQGEQFGDFVTVDGQHRMGDPWGIIVGIYKENNLLRYEYRQRGTQNGCANLELANRYQMYVRYFAMARALEREGDGQDLELAAHYQLRYEAGIARMLKRQAAMAYQRKYVFGGGPKRESRLPLARLPWQYGSVVKG